MPSRRFVLQKQTFIFLNIQQNCRPVGWLPVAAAGPDTTQLPRALDQSSVQRREVVVTAPCHQSAILPPSRSTRPATTSAWLQPAPLQRVDRIFTPARKREALRITVPFESVCLSLNPSVQFGVLLTKEMTFLVIRILRFLARCHFPYPPPSLLLLVHHHHHHRHHHHGISSAPITLRT